MIPRVAFETLGCKLNQYETDAIAAGFRDLGWEIVPSGTEAEAYVVNTCTVTNKADRKSRNILGHHLDHFNSPIVVVTGCFAESSRESLEGKDGITFVIPNLRKNQIPALVDGHFRNKITAPELPPPDPFGFSTHSKIFHTRASIKVQDGCDNFCSFCIIPSVRGPALSRPFQAVLTSARELIEDGRKELVLTGVNMGRWSEGGRTFAELVAALLAMEGDFRIRITSLEPEALDEDFLALFDHPKMCPHLHLCLQSGSPRILAAMGRAYSRAQYATWVERLRERHPHLNLTTDLIVGFPGEVEEDFQASWDAVEAFGFGAVHVFPYSKRQGTRAETMEGQVPEVIKTRRAQALQGWSNEQRRKKMETLRGQVRRVLVETPDENRSVGTLLKGLTEDYFPVRFYGKAQWNDFCTVRISEIAKEGSEWVCEAVPV